MKLQAKWIDAPNTRTVMDLLADGGHQVYFVGGCVRNALMDVPVTDLDISSDARPDRVQDLAAKAGLKAMPTGIEHGTVTVMIDGTGYEVTTFRKDIETDGRRAVVAFSDNITDDARRRDFTINALYADRHGQVIDPLGGLDDIKSRRVRFIDDPHQRIKEDYLRILRFFRFYSWYGDPDAGIDPEGMAACAELAEGLKKISKERIGAEVLKLLSAPDPSQSISSMAYAGVLNVILPGADTNAIAPLIHMEGAHDVVIDPLLRLAALFAEETGEYLRLSKKQTNKLKLLQTSAKEDIPPHELGYRHGYAEGMNISLLRAAAIGHPLGDIFAELALGANATFPISAQDLMPQFSAQALGEKLNQLETDWIASKFTKQKQELL